MQTDNKYLVYIHVTKNFYDLDEILKNECGLISHKHGKFDCYNLYIFENDLDLVDGMLEVEKLNKYEDIKDNILVLFIKNKQFNIEDVTPIITKATIKQPKYSDLFN